MVWQPRERSSCGVGFVALRTGHPEHAPLETALRALACVEHRGACSADQISSDGAGVMTDIPFGLFGFSPGQVAVATLFVPTNHARQRRVLEVFEQACAFFGAPIHSYRRVPVAEEVLGPQARADRPDIVQAFIERPPWSKTGASFNVTLYAIKQSTRSHLKDINAFDELVFASLSQTTIVYKALTRADALAAFYPDLQRPEYLTRFALFHRRFSTNTRTSWDKAQPFRLIAHNGEINTIAGNRSWSYSREQAMGIRRDELLTHNNISDSGNLNEMVEALKYRSSIPRVEDILAIMMPPAVKRNDYYAFWGRAMEPWDGPAFITYCEGKTIGARLDRNGFRPCRWAMTDDAFYLASEAGVFGLDEASILHKGTLQAGSGVTVVLDSGQVHLRDPSGSRENARALFDARFVPLESREPESAAASLEGTRLFGITTEDIDRFLVPMIADGKEPIGSMGDTARPAILSREPRSLFDYLYQTFAQVTNPPLDYLRERMVTDLTTHIGLRPNIFAPKELLPLTPALAAETPILTRGQLAYLRTLVKRSAGPGLKTAELDCTFDDWQGAVGLRNALTRIGEEALRAVHDGFAILLLTDRHANGEHLPVPSLLALRAVVNTLNARGLRLEASIVCDAGDVFTAHHVACIIGFGATAVCPRLAFDIAEYTEHRALDGIPARDREGRLARALEGGLLKVMSKMGISVVRSYQSSKLFSPLGLGDDLLDLFVGLESPIGGIGLKEVADAILQRAASAGENSATPLPSTYQLREHPKGRTGERHGMTARRAKSVHEFVRSGDETAYDDYLHAAAEDAPVHLRDLLTFVPSESPLEVDAVEPAKAILNRFGSGAMSFGAISAESQRDLFVAMRSVGGHSNSGEGGENPYYFVDGTTASCKQIASGRFGVTAEYLVTGDEIQIKIAQGAKPGEGGQLMGVKVDEHIARARHARPGVDLISPPPLHDIYSIEDLKELIYELRQVAPNARIGVKLVAGTNVGTIAVGVAKAGADVIQISGGNGGTGAATLTSMRHAGLPWELGLSEAHRALSEHGLRPRVRLSVDGGLHTADDVVKAACLGAEQYGFGKLLLVAQGCIMARICEKNRCPTGIATHDPRFKAKYKGRAEHVVALLERLAEDVRRRLADLGARRLSDIIGRGRLLQPDPRHEALVRERNLDLSCLLSDVSFDVTESFEPAFIEPTSALDERIVEACRPLWEASEASNPPIALRDTIRSTDRAVLTRLSGLLAQRSHRLRMQTLRQNDGPDFSPHTLDEASIRIELTGSAGQGFGAFLVGGLDVTLFGEANDSVCKSMSGGRVVVRPHPDAAFDAAENVILGNCALYGATGGRLFVGGRVGDRFAVRNSGAIAVVEGAGLHTCEYMTGGTVVILGTVAQNVGAGMTGGTIFLPRSRIGSLNEEYVEISQLDDESRELLRTLLEEHGELTGSRTSRRLLDDWSGAHEHFVACRPSSEGHPS